MPRHPKTIALTIATALVLTACHQKQAATAQQEMASADMTSAAEPSPASTQANAASRSNTELGAEDYPTRRMIIRTGQLEVTLEEMTGASDRVAGVATRLDGFVQASNSTRYNGYGQTQMTLRVPSENFDRAMQELRAMGEVSREHISGQDVTAEFTDLTARLRAQRQLEERFLALLSGAQSVDDALSIERELARVRTEIEQIEGRRKVLADQAALSTIELTVRPADADHVTSPGLLDELGDAFEDAGEIFVAVVGGIVRVVGGLIPVGLALALVASPVVIWWRRRKRS